MIALAHKHVVPLDLQIFETKHLTHSVLIVIRAKIADVRESFQSVLEEPEIDVDFRLEAF